MKQLRSRLPGSTLVKLAPVGLALVLVVMGPTAAFARMHFTTTNDRLTALSQAANSSLALNDPAAIQTQLNEITTQATAAKAAAEEAATRPASNADDIVNEQFGKFRHAVSNSVLDSVDSGADVLRHPRRPRPKTGDSHDRLDFTA